MPNDIQKETIVVFHLFYDHALFQTILAETNNYARDFLDSEAMQACLAQFPSSRFHKWPEEASQWII